MPVEAPRSRRAPARASRSIWRARVRRGRRAGGADRPRARGGAAVVPDLAAGGVGRRTTAPRRRAALAEAMNQRAPLAVRVNTARDHARGADRRSSPRSTSSRAPTRAGAGRAGARDARERLRPVGVPRRPVRGDGRGEPAGRRAGGAAAGRARGRRLRGRGRQDAGARRRRWRARGACWRSTPTARSSRSCAGARAAPG